MQSRTGDATLRLLPKVDQLLVDAGLVEAARGLPREILRREVQHQVAVLRARLLDGGDTAVTTRDAAETWVRDRVRAALERLGVPSLRQVINATGVVLHTNLGRARLSADAVRAVVEAATWPTNLEYDLETGQRASRMQHAEDLLCRLLGCEAAFVVNNNAAALLLAIDTLGKAGVVVSRGEQIEIGDGFRLPDILAKSAVPIHEVGTTNWTRVEDYTRVVDRPGVVFLKVHRSNFAVSGYTGEASVADLVLAAAGCGATVVYDLGSGSYERFEAHGLPGEPDVRTALASGAPVVTMSGDKLLGGPQAGILVGARAAIEPMRRNPLARALRIDKLSLAALQATLLSCLRTGADVPTTRFILSQPAEIQARADTLVERLQGQVDAELQVAATQASVGGGSFADTELPSFELRIRPRGMSGTELLARLRRGRPAVVARIKDDTVGLDLRCVTEPELIWLAQAVATALQGRGGGVR